MLLSFREICICFCCGFESTKILGAPSENSTCKCLYPPDLPQCCGAAWGHIAKGRRFTLGGCPAHWSLCFKPCSFPPQGNSTQWSTRASWPPPQAAKASRAGLTPLDPCFSRNLIYITSLISLRCFTEMFYTFCHFSELSSAGGIVQLKLLLS